MIASMTNRLAPQPGEVINRRERLSFTWNGAAFPGFAGDTIVSALAACGVRVFSRSYKYHRAARNPDRRLSRSMLHGAGRG